MTLPPLAPVSDLAAWVGQTIESADARAGAVLSAASALVRAYTGQTWTDDQDELANVPEVVSAIVVQAAARVWLNPSGLTSFTIDDGTRRWGEAGAVGLYLTEPEKSVLADFSAANAPDIGTISFTRGPLGLDTIYVSTAPEPSGQPFPWYAAEDFG